MGAELDPSPPDPPLDGEGAFKISASVLQWENLGEHKVRPYVEGRGYQLGELQ